METIARMRNEGNFEVVAEIEENNIMTKGLANFYDFSDTKLVDRKLCMKINDIIFSTARDNFPNYTSFDGDWKQGTYDVVPGGTVQQTGYIDLTEFNYTSLDFLITGEVLVELSDFDCDIKVGVTFSYIKPDDGSQVFSWGGAIIGNTSTLKEQGWTDIFKKLKIAPGGRIICIKPWIQIEKNNVDNHTHRVIYNNLTIEPEFETLERYTNARHIKIKSAGVYNPLGGYIDHNNLYQVEVIDINGENVALNKPVVTDRTDYDPKYGTPSIITTANPTTWNEFKFTADKPNVTYSIDLGKTYKIKSVNVREWNQSTRQYLDKVYTSIDGGNWSLIQDSYTPLVNDEKQIYQDLPTTPHTLNSPLEFSVFGEMDGFINSASPLSSLASHLDNAKLFDKSKNINVSWILDNTAPTKSRVVAKMDAPSAELAPTASCRVETPQYFNISDYNYRCFATAWVKVDKDYKGGTPLLSIEEYPGYTAKSVSYDMNRKGEWQKLSISVEWEPKEGARYFAFVRNIWSGNPAWTKGSLYVADLQFGGNPLNITNLPYIEKLYPTTFYSVPPKIVKPKGAIFLEFDLNNFNNKGWLSFFHIYTPIEGNVELKKINLIYHNQTKILMVRINDNVRIEYPLSTCRALNNRICLIWGDSGIYSIFNGVSSKISNTNVIEGNFESFCLGSWIGNDNECNNNIYKLAIYDETLTVDDAIELTKPNSKVSLTDTTIESDNFIEGYNFTDELYQTGFNYFQLADNFDEYYDKQIKLKNIYDYNNNAYFCNDALLISPRYRNRWKIAFGEADYSYKNIPNLVSLPTYVASNTSLTISFIYNTHELTDEELNLNITCFTGGVRDTTKVIPLEKTGDIYKQFEITIPLLSDRNANIEFSVTGQGYARMKNVCICPVSYITSHEILEDDDRKLGFSMNLKESIGHEWNNGFTMIYKKKAIATSYLADDKNTGYIIDALGTYSNGKGYLWFGKYPTGNAIQFGLYSNSSISFHKQTFYIDISLMYEWYTIAMIYNPITKRLRVYYIFIDGTIDYIEIEYINGYELSYDELVSTVSGTDFKFDFTINGWNINNTKSDACAGYLKDLLIVKRSMDIEEIKELISPLSLGVDSIRAGMELSERNIL